MLSAVCALTAPSLRWQRFYGVHTELALEMQRGQGNKTVEVCPPPAHNQPWNEHYSEYAGPAFLLQCSGSPTCWWTTILVKSILCVFIFMFFVRQFHENVIGFSSRALGSQRSPKQLHIIAVRTQLNVQHSVQRRKNTKRNAVASPLILAQSISWHFRCDHCTHSQFLCVLGDLTALLWQPSCHLTTLSSEPRATSFVLCMLKVRAVSRRSVW